MLAEYCPTLGLDLAVASAFVLPELTARCHRRVPACPWIGSRVRCFAWLLPITQDPHGGVFSQPVRFAHDSMSTRLERGGTKARQAARPWLSWVSMDA